MKHKAAAGAFDAILKDAGKARLGDRVAAEHRPSPEFLIQIGICPVGEEEEEEDEE